MGLLKIKNITSAVWTSNDGRATAEVVNTWAHDDYGRRVWRYVFEGEGDDVYEISGSDLYGGLMPSGDDPAAMLASLGTFVAAWMEARDYGPRSENGHLFPASLGPWVDAWGDEFTVDMSDHENGDLL